jgi:hypothetical protein
MTFAPEMSLNKLSISSIKKMPVVLGEVDVLKSLLLLPELLMLEREPLVLMFAVEAQIKI